MGFKIQHRISCFLQADAGCTYLFAPICLIAHPLGGSGDRRRHPRLLGDQNLPHSASERLSIFTVDSRQ